MPRLMLFLYKIHRNKDKRGATVGLRQFCGAGICLFLERSEERTDTAGRILTMA